MSDKNTLTYKLASLVSTIGNPLITTSIFILFVTTKLFTPWQAAWISFLVIAVIAIPVAVNNYVKTRNGQYTNFDLSDRQQRQEVYPRLIFLIVLVTAVLFATGQPLGFCLGSLVFTLMMITSYLINFKLKVSMHTSISVFLAFCMFKLSITGGAAMLVFALSISISRLILKRHTPAEVLAGGLLGSVFGLINYIL